MGEMPAAVLEAFLYAGRRNGPQRETARTYPRQAPGAPDDNLGGRGAATPAKAPCARRKAVATPTVL